MSKWMNEWIQEVLKGTPDLYLVFLLPTSKSNGQLRAFFSGPQYLSGDPIEMQRF